MKRIRLMCFYVYAVVAFQYFDNKGLGFIYFFQHSFPLVFVRSFEQTI
jgi:hypothetical protein